MLMLFTTILTLVIVPVHASTLFVEDWGISPGTWVPTNAPSNVKWTTEDYVGPGGYVGPGWGGQPFDAEAAYFATEGSKVYIAIVTGLPQSGVWGYDPGDVAINIGNDNIYDFAITTRNTNINSQHTPTPGAGWLLSNNLQWTNTQIYWGGVSNPWAVKSYGSAINLGNNFSYSAFGGDHYAIEAIIDNSLLGLINGDVLSLHWTMECGNDNINLINATVEGLQPVPEPSTILLLSSGIGGILVFYKKRKKLVQ